jgi:aminoglycoside phosphotransferase family enzyme
MSCRSAATVSHPLVGSSNSVFEHALRMVQFEPGCELTALLEGGTVDATEIAKLGADVARLHASATVADAASEWGVPAHLHEVTLANFTELAQQLQDDGCASRLASLRSHAESLFGEARVLLEERRNAGFVRECHGDMHCGNVVRWRERLTPFDGLEFDPALRYIDVASDVAFLSMDLAVRGPCRPAPALAQRVLRGVRGFCGGRTAALLRNLSRASACESYRAAPAS